MDKLEPCPNPWCEAAEREGDYSPAVGVGHWGNWRVICPSCCMKGPTRQTADEAIAAWDHRPTPAAVGDMVLVPREPTEAMVEAVEAVNFSTDDERAMACNVWQAMIAAAAPAAPPPLCQRTLAAAAKVAAAHAPFSEKAVANADGFTLLQNSHDVQCSILARKIEAAILALEKIQK